MPKTTALQLDKVSKMYSQQKIGSLRHQFGEMFNPQNSKNFLALDDISLHVNQGEAVGIIGRNGAGKSTLLKIISGITAPSDGSVRIRGSVGSLLEVGTGFHPELTGRENIYLNGSILGMSKSYIKDRFDDIVKFSGVEKFIEMPLKTYSSGMYMRLAFSVAAFIETDILLIDEVLAVGDLAYRKKSLEKMKEMIDSGRTLLFVSHNMDQVKAICDRCVYLSEGKIVEDGNTNDVVNTYLHAESKTIRNIISEDKPKDPGFISAATINREHKYQSFFKRGETIGWEIQTHSSVELKNVQIRVVIHTSSGVLAVAMRSGDVGIQYDLLGTQKFRFFLDPIIFSPGLYDVMIELELGETNPLVRLSQSIEFEVTQEDIWNGEFKLTNRQGIVQSRGEWTEIQL